MGMFDRFLKTKERALKTPKAPLSADDFLNIMGWSDHSSASGVTVIIDNSLCVPAMWSLRLLKEILLLLPTLRRKGSGACGGGFQASLGAR